MENIGKIIKYFREQKGFSQAMLAHDICSSKYIYLIEKAERLPSIAMIEALGNKLGVDFYEYLPYASCNDPLYVKKAIDTFMDSRKRQDFNNLEAKTKAVHDSIDFKAMPWEGEIIYNNAILQTFRDKDPLGTTRVLKKAIAVFGSISKNDPRRILNLSPSLARLYNMLFISFMKSGAIPEAYKLIDFIKEELDQVRDVRRYQDIYITICLNYIKTLDSRSLFIKQLTTCEDLRLFQLKSHNIERMHITIFLEAMALSSLNRTAQASELFKKALFLGYSLGEKNVLQHMLSAYDLKTLFSNNPSFLSFIDSIDHL